MANKIFIILILVFVLVCGSCFSVFADNYDTYELEQVLLTLGGSTSWQGVYSGRHVTDMSFPITEQQYLILTNGTSFVTLNIQYQRQINNVWTDSTSTYFVQISSDNMHNGNLGYNALTSGIHLLYYTQGTQYRAKLVFLTERRVENGVTIDERVSSFGYVIVNNSTPSFELGYNAGYTDGNQIGYENGFNDGYSQNPFVVNPMLVIFNSVQDLLNVKLFGELSLGNLLTGIIGITFLIWFLKMFKGG